MVHQNKEKDARSEQLKRNLIYRIKKIGIWSVCIILVVLAIYALWPDSIDVTNMPVLYTNKIGITDHVAGNNLSKVLIVEYSDYQCPACASYAPLIENALKEKGSKFQFVYRNFPLKLIHANAVPSARASEAAALQGKFWEMNALLFEKQSEWEDISNPENTFASYAVQLGLDETKFRTDYKSKQVAAKVENDYISGMRYNVQSTPTFYLNGQPIRFGSYAELSALIDRYSK